MNHKAHESLVELLIPIDALIPLTGNPRVGNIDAIAASYGEFGQLKPIVIYPNGDDTYTIIAGNHQTEAAKRLGWTHIAAVQIAEDEQKSIAFALTDNRVSDLGKTDQEALRDMLSDVVEIYPELFDAIGWDDFELAGLDTVVSTYSEVSNGASSGYVPPMLTSRPGEISGMNPVANEGTDSRDAHFTLPEGLDQHAAVVGGSPATGQAGTQKTSFQYTLVFDNAEQMKQWWDFLRILRSSAAYEGDTIAAKFISFLESHSEA